jgi:hypothetical protein
MFCIRCGNTVEAHARFCSKCGQEVTAASQAIGPAPAAAPLTAKKIERDMNMHVNILAWLLIANGILAAIGGIAVLFVGQFMRRMPIEHGMPPGMPAFVAWLSSVGGLFLLCLAAAIVAAGVGLLEYRSWARTVATVAAALLLLHFPIGTAVAIYAFWVLFSEEGQRYYKSRSESTMTASGT